jgi:hypothetical protein
MPQGPGRGLGRGEGGTREGRGRDERGTREGQGRDEGGTRERGKGVCNRNRGVERRWNPKALFLSKSFEAGHQ